MDQLEIFKNMTPEEANTYLEELNACEHDCSSCSSDCAGKTSKPAKKVIAMTGGKGGTGKSVVTVLLAKALIKKGLKAAILDADIAGSNIPQLLGMTEPVLGEVEVLAPAVSDSGIPVVSYALIAEDIKEPIIWPGLDLAKVAVYLFQDTQWGDLDVLLVDMPSGAGDIPLEYYTTMPFDNSLIVAIPGEAARLSQLRAANLAEMLMVPVMGVVENFADKDFKLAEIYNELPVVASMEYDPALRSAADEGRLGAFETETFDFLARAIAESL